MPNFTPAEPPGVLGVTVLWQYAIDNLRNGAAKGHGLVDYDLANQTGYDTMWASNSISPGGGTLV